MGNFFSLAIRSRLFWLGIFLRVLIIPVGTSYYLTDLFLPFIDRSIENFGVNPWSLGNPGEFPYGSILYMVMVPFKLFGFGIFGPASLGTGSLSLILFKLPLLLADIGLLFGLFSLNGQKLHRLLLFYWLNPVLIAITYGITQLDVVSMAFLFWSLIYLINRKTVLSGLFFGFALLCKFHVALLIPFLMAYLWNNYFRNDALARIVAWLSLVITVSVLGFAPHFMVGSIGAASAGSPEAQRIFGMILRLGDTNVLYLGVFALLLLVGRLCFSTKITPSGLIFGCGALMTTLVLTVNPSEGWYFWFLPFVALLYAQYLSLPRLLLVGLSVCYFLYFFAGQEQVGTLWSGIYLTSLQTFTACYLMAFFVYVLKFDTPIFRRLRPFMIGIGGDSGAGKNYFSENLKALFGEKSTRTIEGDDYHKWERGSVNWKNLTHLNPLANNLDVLLNHSVAIKRGQSVDSRHYDHSTGRFTEAREISPAKLVIFQGLHALYGKVFREKLDLRIFLRPSEQVRKAWKIQRDVSERGHAEEKVLQAMESRKPDSAQHILPQEEGADWSISYDLDANSNYLVSYRFRQNPSLLEFLQNLKPLGCEVVLQPSGPEELKVLISGNPRVEEISEFAKNQFSSLRQMLRNSTPPVWKSGLDGVNQLILLFLLSVGGEESSWH